MEGLTMLPAVSEPMAKATRPAAVAAPGPALLPLEPSSRSQGFMVWPPNQMSLRARAPRLNLAMRTAPAALRRGVTEGGAGVVAGGDLGVGGFGLREGVVAGEGDDAVDLGIEAFDAGEVDV